MNTLEAEAYSLPGESAVEVTEQGLFYQIYKNAGIANLNLYFSTVGETLRIPDSVTYQGEKYQVTSFSTNVNWYEDRSELMTEYFGDEKYRNNHHTNLKKLIIPSGITGDISVTNCLSLEEIIFENPDDIEGYNFVDCPQLKKIYLTKNANTAPFIKKCPKLEVEISPENSMFKVEGNAIYSKNGKVLYNVNSAVGKYTVATGVVRIAKDAFSGNDQITSLYFPDSVKMKKLVQSFHLYHMEKLKNIRWSNAMTVFPRTIFHGVNYKIKKLDFPKSFNYINGNSMEFMKHLKYIYIKAPKLKKAPMSRIPKTYTIYVKNNTVKNQVKKYGFTGKIVVKANLN